MPLYEFVCRKCEASFEVLVSSSSSDAPPCPKCQGTEVERIMSVVSIGRANEPMPAPSGCAGCPSRGSGGGCPID